ncbi:hypothetical protein TNCV_4940351 [Trichonephila clavipes]|nr:hypothetical protein TNCV_4940351 [Trichonephila clavipes]
MFGHHFHMKIGIIMQADNSTAEPVTSAALGILYQFMQYVSLQQWGTLNSRRAGGPLVRFAEEEKRWEALKHLQGVLPQNRGGTEPNHTVTCLVLKATTNYRRTSRPLPR